MKRYSLVGVDGNAYVVMGYTSRAMHRAGFSKEEIDEMMNKAMSSNYDNLLCVCMEYIDKVNEKLESEGEEFEDDDF